METKKVVEEILQKATDDISFRELLLTDPKAALANSGLNADVIELLSSMRRVALEEWGIDVKKSRAFLRDNGTKTSPRIPPASATLSL